ncbi:MAG TPA: hypothetical protein VM099_05280 [Gemmatimonadaceae bacterium]|nr:hypothetical protein [Gemmatimonadaceae bacterium]
MKRHFLISAFAVVAILATAWSLVTPWAAGFFPIRPDHYDVGLFGVKHVSDMTTKSTQTKCTWNQRLDACAPAIGGEDNFVKLARAKWFIVAGLAFTTIGIAALRMRTAGVWTAAPFVIAALAIGAGITLVRSNAGSALAALAGARVDLTGSGMLAAEIAAGACFLAAVVAAIPASHSHSGVGAPKT